MALPLDRSDRRIARVPADGAPTYQTISMDDDGIDVATPTALDGPAHWRTDLTHAAWSPPGDDPERGRLAWQVATNYGQRSLVETTTGGHKALIRCRLHDVRRWLHNHRLLHLLNILVQARRDANAAKRFFKRMLKSLQYLPRVIVTDKLRSLASLSVNCFLASSTGKADIWTIETRTRMGRREDKSGRCNALDRPNKPRTSSPLTLLSTVSFIPADTNLQSKSIEKSGSTIENLAPRDVRPTRRISGTARLPLAPFRTRDVDVTMPTPNLSCALIFDY
jgi:hypothetical protein